MRVRLTPPHLYLLPISVVRIVEKEHSRSTDPHVTIFRCLLEPNKDALRHRDVHGRTLAHRLPCLLDHPLQSWHSSTVSGHPRPCVFVIFCTLTNRPSEWRRKPQQGFKPPLCRRVGMSLVKWDDREVERGWCSHCVTLTEHTRQELTWLTGVWRSSYKCNSCGASCPKVP